MSTTHQDQPTQPSIPAETLPGQGSLFDGLSTEEAPKHEAGSTQQPSPAIEQTGLERDDSTAESPIINNDTAQTPPVTENAYHEQQPQSRWSKSERISAAITATALLVGGAIVGLSGGGSSDEASKPELPVTTEDGLLIPGTRAVTEEPPAQEMPVIEDEHVVESSSEVFTATDIPEVFTVASAQAEKEILRVIANNHPNRRSETEPGDRNLQMWRGPAMTKALNSQGEEVIMRMEYPLEVEVGDSLYWVARNTTTGETYTLNIGHKNATTGRFNYNDFYYTDVRPWNYAGVGDSGQLVSAKPTEISDEGIRVLDNFASKREGHTVVRFSTVRFFLDSNEALDDSLGPMDDIIHFGVDPETDAEILADYYWVKSELGEEIE